MDSGESYRVKNKFYTPAKPQGTCNPFSIPKEYLSFQMTYDPTMLGYLNDN